MHFPNRVWELGDTDESGRQLYWSHEPTKEDKARRAELEREFEGKGLNI